MKLKSKLRTGFTLIELLIVIAIIAILVSVIFVALNPLKRFRDTRDAVRAEDINNILNAIMIDQVDNGGDFLSAIQNMSTNTVYMIGEDTSGCNNYNTYCDTNVDYGVCVDLTALEDQGYLAEIPVSPTGDYTWTSGRTGYTIERNAVDALFIRACESEGRDEIWLAR